MWSVWSRLRLPSQCLRILYAEMAPPVCIGLGQVGLAFDGIEYLGGQDHRVPATASLCKPAPFHGARCSDTYGRFAYGRQRCRFAPETFAGYISTAKLKFINRLAGGEDPSASPFLCPDSISSPLPQPGYATRLCMLGADFLAYFIQGSILESLPLHKRNGMDFDLKLRWMSRRSPSKAMETMFAAEENA